MTTGLNVATPSRCRWPDCGIELVPQRTERAPGQRYHKGRGLCVTHHSRAQALGILTNFPSAKRSVEETVAEWEHIGGRELHVRIAATRLGMNWRTLERALLRAKARGLL